MRESEFQAKVVKKIKALYPSAYIFKTDASQKQGMPDILILYKNIWAALEFKRSANATHRPNQDYRVNQLNDMSFARFIYPENESEVLYELQQALGS